MESVHSSQTQSFPFQTPDSIPHRREGSKVRCSHSDVECSSKSLVPSWMLLLGDRTFKKWDLLGGSWVTEDVSLRPQALSCPCIARHHEDSPFILP